MSLCLNCSYTTTFLACQGSISKAALYVGLETLKRSMKAKDAAAPQSAPGPMMAIDERFDDSGEDSDVDSVV